jgi:hypothetical protein
MGKIIGSLVISYFIIGSVIFGSQLALSTFLDPVCIGAEQHRLLDRYFPTQNQIHELEKTRTGKRDIGDVPWILKSGLHVAQWLPDLYREVEDLRHNLAAAEGEAQANLDYRTDEESGEGFVESDADMVEDRAVGEHFVEINKPFDGLDTQKGSIRLLELNSQKRQEDQTEDQPVKKQSSAADHLLRNSLVTSSA